MAGLVSTFTPPFSRPLPRDMTGRGPGGGGSYPADLAFYALDTQNGSFVADVIVGTGSITEAAATTRYYPDENNVWQAFGPGVVNRYYRGDGYWYAFCAGFTNSLTYSFDLTNPAWTKTNVTPTKNQTGMRGDANGATLLTATANNGTVIRAAAVTAASNPHGSRWFIERVTGTGTIEITMDNGATWSDITAALAASSGWFEGVMAQTVVNPQVGIRIGTSGDEITVGNVDLAIDPTVGSETASGILRGNSPVFTEGSTGSVDQTTITANGANQGGTADLWYGEKMPLSDDADYGLTDVYIPSFSATQADATACNFANGQVFSSQYLQPAVGGSTTQVTRSVVAGERLRFASWYNAAENTASFSLDGDVTSGATPFSGFFSDGTLHLIRLQGGSNSGVILIRNLRRYTIANMEAGRQLAIDLINGTEAWGQNRVALSNRPDLYTQNNNPWTVTGATVTRNSDGTCTITDPDGSLRVLRQSGIPITADTQPYTVRYLVKKDAITARFIELHMTLTGGTNQNGYVQLDTSTGAFASRAGNAATWTVQDFPHDATLREVVGTIVNNGTNPLANLLGYPGAASVLGGATVAALTGSYDQLNAELYVGKVTADVLGQPVAYTPQAKAPEVNPS